VSAGVVGAVDVQKSMVPQEAGSHVAVYRPMSEGGMPQCVQQGRLAQHVPQNWRNVPAETWRPWRCCGRREGGVRRGVRPRVCGHGRVIARAVCTRVPNPPGQERYPCCRRGHAESHSRVRVATRGSVTRGVQRGVRCEEVWCGEGEERQRENEAIAQSIDPERLSARGEPERASRGKSTPLPTPRQ